MHDGSGAAVKGFLQLTGDVVRKLQFDPLSRELNRGQRVLNLMRESSRDLAPGCVALRLNEIGYIIENDDVIVLVFMLFVRGIIRVSNFAKQ